MTNTAIQKKGIGTEIISGLCNYLKQAGFAAIHLSWVKGNPQAEHFWKKNKSIQPFEANVSWFGCAIPLSRQCRDGFSRGEIQRLGRLRVKAILSVHSTTSITLSGIRLP